MRSGEEIQSDLHAFADRWEDFHGTERAEAQTFLNELFQCYGRDRRDAGGRFEDPQDSGGIVDLLVPGTCIVEMKAPAESNRLDQHRKQALDYWHHSDDLEAGRPAPPYVVLCSFQRFEVWEPGRFPSAPRDTFTLEELPDRYETLLFLAGEEPLFLAVRRDLTTEATGSIVELSNALQERSAAPPETIQRFALQIVWCLFAESLGLLSGRPVERIMEAKRNDPSRSTAADLGRLFELLDQHDTHGKSGVYEGTPYANGELFAVPAKVELNEDEVELLAQAANYEWRDVDPTIFGSLLGDDASQQQPPQPKPKSSLWSSASSSFSTRRAVAGTSSTSRIARCGG